MRIAETLLLFFSRKPGTHDYHTMKKEWNLENALSLLCRAFPNFMTSISGKKILDFGCGTGWQSLALARNGAKYVLGLDTNQEYLEKVRHLAELFGFGEQVVFADKLEDNFKGKFDMVISQNSMEHFGDPVNALDEMRSALNQDGMMLITFGPPWFAPYGSHMFFFTRIPWVNVMFSERTVMSVRAHFRNDGATKYEEVEGGLNRMTVAEFERIICDSGMRSQYKKYDCVKGVNFMGRLPLMRELFINHISCVLTHGT